MVTAPQSPGQVMWEQILSVYVRPEIERRQSKGAPKPFVLLAGQVVFYPDDRGNQIRLNDEVAATCKISLKPGAQKEKGEDAGDVEDNGVGFQWIHGAIE